MKATAAKHKPWQNTKARLGHQYILTLKTLKPQELQVPVIRSNLKWKFTPDIQLNKQNSETEKPFAWSVQLGRHRAINSRPRYIIIEILIGINSHPPTKHHLKAQMDHSWCFYVPRHGRCASVRACYSPPLPLPSWPWLLSLKYSQHGYRPSSPPNTHHNTIKPHKRIVGNEKTKDIRS